MNTECLFTHTPPLLRGGPKERLDEFQEQCSLYNVEIDVEKPSGGGEVITDGHSVKCTMNEALRKMYLCVMFIGGAHLCSILQVVT